MTHLQKLPYLTPSVKRIRHSQWQLISEDALIPLGDLLPYWDAAMPIRASIKIEIDTRDILSDCALSTDAQLRLVATWYSAGTGLRECGSFQNLNNVLSGQNFTLKINVEGQKLSSSIMLTANLVLVNPGTRSNALAPRIPGSLLWHVEHPVVLEGQGARFPMELVDFGASSWLPENAAWFLDWRPDDLDQLVLGGIRLYINARHEKVRQAVSEQRELDFTLKEAMRFDIARAMITSALNNSSFITAPEQFGDDTVGAAIRRLVRALFPDRNLQSLQMASQQYPHRFECELQDKLKLYW
jgi:hypothetical protein